jgi:hypothetical protein
MSPHAMFSSLSASGVSILHDTAGHMLNVRVAQFSPVSHHERCNWAVCLVCNHSSLWDVPFKFCWGVKPDPAATSVGRVMYWWNLPLPSPHMPSWHTKWWLYPYLLHFLHFCVMYCTSVLVCYRNILPPPSGWVILGYVDAELIG